jgi:hypothetical protein
VRAEDGTITWATGTLDFAGQRDREFPIWLGAIDQRMRAMKGESEHGHS